MTVQRRIPGVTGSEDPAWSLSQADKLTFASIHFHYDRESYSHIMRHFLFCQQLFNASFDETPQPTRLHPNKVGSHQADRRLALRMARCFGY